MLRYLVPAIERLTEIPKIPSELQKHAVNLWELLARVLTENYVDF